MYGRMECVGIMNLVDFIIYRYGNDVNTRTGLGFANAKQKRWDEKFLPLHIS